MLIFFIFSDIEIIINLEFLMNLIPMGILSVN